MKNSLPYNDTPKHFMVWLFGFNYEQASDEHRMIFDQYADGEIGVYAFLDIFEQIQGVIICWDQISYKSEITEYFANYYFDKLYWGLMFSNPHAKFSKEFIDANKHRIEWYDLKLNTVKEIFIERIGADVVEYNEPKIWLELSYRNDLTLKFIETYQDKLNWRLLSQGKLSDNFISIFSNRLAGYIDESRITEAVARCRKLKLKHLNDVA